MTDNDSEAISNDQIEIKYGINIYNSKNYKDEKNTSSLKEHGHQLLLNIYNEDLEKFNL